MANCTQCSFTGDVPEVLDHMKVVHGMVDLNPNKKCSLTHSIRYDY